MTINSIVDQWDFSANVSFRPASDSKLQPLEDVYDIRGADIKDAQGNAIEQFQTESKYGLEIESLHSPPGAYSGSVKFTDGSYLYVTVMPGLL